MLSSISIQGFKAITEKLELNNLAPINYLIGPNGSGKSSVLEGVYKKMVTSKSFLKDLPNLGWYKNENGEVHKRSVKIFNDQEKDLEFGVSGGDDSEEVPLFINRKTELLAQYFLENREIKSIDLEFHDNLINKYKYLDWNLYKSTYLAGDECENKKLSDGELAKSAFFNLLSKFEREEDSPLIGGLFAKYSIVLIEEPEHFLHPEWQKEIPKWFQEWNKRISVFANYTDGDKDKYSKAHRPMAGYITENGEFPSSGFVGGKFNSTQFLISTHSPFIINSALELDRERYESLSDEDKKSFKPTHKVYHLDKVDGITKLVGEIPTTSSATQERNFVSTYDSILGSIGVQPSDLLFANGVIWVEGPSDAIYIEHWLKLYQEKLKKENPELKVLKKGSAYSFQMLNLICLNHTGANEKFWNDPESIQEAINLLEINRKFVVVIDNDGDFENCLPNANSESPSQRERKIKFLDKIKEQKKIISEGYEGIRNNEMDFWIGKEAMTIENYLKNLIAIKGEEGVAQYDSKKEREIIIKNIFNFSKAKPEYTKAKAYYARQICKKFTNLDDFCSEGDELYTNIQSLYATIQSWNEPK
jgi:predicted ATP-dependent endonuclease of OLD family